MASQTAARRRGAGPCSHSGPSAGDHVDQTAASLSAEVTSSPTASASKTSRSGTSSDVSEEEVDRPGAGQRRLQGQGDDRPERRGADQQVGEDRPAAPQVVLDGEHRLAGLLRGHARAGADGELQPLGGVDASSELAPSGTRCSAASTRLRPAPSTVEHPGARPGQPHGQQFGAAEAGSRRRRRARSCEARRRWSHAHDRCVRAGRAIRWPRARSAAWPDRRGGTRSRRSASAVRRAAVRRPRAAGRGAPTSPPSRPSAAALERSPLPGQRELVPAARTVLVVLDRPPTELDVAALRRLGPRRRPPVGGAAGRSSCPSSSTGPDLAEVAELTGRTVPALVAALTAVELTVAFGGFAPGFGYLTGLPDGPARAAPGDPAHPRPGRARSAWPGRSPAPIRGRRRAAGSWSAAPTPSSSTSTATRPRCSRPARRVRFREVG